MSWVAIEGYIGIYAVSDDGQVMSMNYAKSGLPGIMTPRLRRGYQSVFLRKKGNRGRNVTVHSLVASAFIGPRLDGLEVNHKDGNKLNNNVENLEYVTRSENAKHACKLYLIDSRGEKHSQHKLTALQVEEILSALQNGSRVGELAKKYGVDQSQISHIKAGRAWRHIDRKVG